MKRFSARVARDVDATKYLYIRAGTEHRFVPIWVVVVDGRVIVRPWNDTPTGWYRVFRRDTLGAIRLAGKTIRVRGVALRGTKLNDAADAAYARKYTTKANQKYVRGFATAKRKATSLELVPV